MIIHTPKTELWQKSVIDAYNSEPNGKWFIVKAIRQCGKSVMCQILLVIASLKHKDAVSICVSPVMTQSRKMFTDVCRFASPIITKANASLLEITFYNGSVVKFKSAEQGDSLRGETCRYSGILIVDEAAYIKDPVFYSILVPTTNVFNSDIIIVSTPKFKKGFYYDLYSDGTSGANEKILVFDWCSYDTSKYLSKETLDIYRKQLPKTSFASEFLGEWISGDGTVFSDFRRCIGDFELDKSNELYITIDWACGNGGDSDSTVITIGQIYGDKVGIKMQYSFNDKKPTEAIEYICSIVRDYVADGFKDITIIGEKNSIGNVYYSMIVNQLDQFEVEYNKNVRYNDEINIDVGTFLTTNDSKKRIIERLETLFENDKIIIPDDERLLTQLSMFEAKVNSNGTILYGVQTGEHDDMILSLCFLVDRLWNEINYK